MRRPGLAVLGSERINVFAPLLIVAGVAWVLLLMGTGSIVIPPLCTGEQIWSLPSAAQYDALFATVPLSTLTAGWCVMVLATMVPTTLVPLLHIQRRSFAGVRTRALLLFIMAYIGVWMCAGGALIGAALVVRMSSDPFWASVAVLGATALWQLSPWKQVALNRCHALPRIAAFAPSVYLGAIGAGARHGFWCVLACWALMLAAMCIPSHQSAAMVVVAVWVWSERLDHPLEPKWQIRWPVTVARMMASWVGRPRFQRNRPIDERLEARARSSAAPMN